MSRCTNETDTTTSTPSTTTSAPKPEGSNVVNIVLGIFVTLIICIMIVFLALFLKKKYQEYSYSLIDENVNNVYFDRFEMVEL